VLSSDLNTRVRCLTLLRDAIAERDPANPVLPELDQILAKIRYVKAGDVMLPEDHNLVVDFLRKAREAIEQLVREMAEELEELRYALVYAQPVYGLTIGLDASPLGMPPGLLNLVRVPSTVLLTRLSVYIGYTSPATELLVEVEQ